MRARTLAAASLMSLVATAASAASFTLDFGNQSYVPGGTPFSMSYENVANDATRQINARIDVDGTYIADAGTASKNGSVDGDIRLNAFLGSSLDVRLTLFDDTIGDGYTAIYDPGTDYDWALTFLDIDSADKPENRMRYYDRLILRTPGTATRGANDGFAQLVEESVPGGLSFSGYTFGDVPGQNGVGSTLTGEQANASVRFGIQNRSVVEFNWSILDPVNGIRAPRNLLIDGGQLAFSGPTVDVEVPPVPLPAALPLLLAGLGALVALRRRA